MTDLDHELGAIRFVVDSPLSSKVAMFNNVASQHKDSQLLNPFSNNDFRTSPRRTFNKDEYGKPIAGSLTEMRGAKANMHVCKEMLQLCQIIDSEGIEIEDEPGLKVISFGDLFNIYTLISDKVVGLLLRARKYKLIHFDGEVLFQRRDDDVPIFMLKPLEEIKKILEEKQDEFRRSVSPSPQPTTIILDNNNFRRNSLTPNSSRNVSPAVSRGNSPSPQTRENSPAPINLNQRKLSESVNPSEIPAPKSTEVPEGRSALNGTDFPVNINGNKSGSVSPSIPNGPAIEGTPNGPAIEGTPNGPAIEETPNGPAIEETPNGPAIEETHIANSDTGEKIKKSHIIPIVTLDKSESCSDVIEIQS